MCAVVVVVVVVLTRDVDAVTCGGVLEAYTTTQICPKMRGCSGAPRRSSEAASAEPVWLQTPVSSPLIFSSSASSAGPHRRHCTQLSAPLHATTLSFAVLWQEVRVYNKKGNIMFFGGYLHFFITGISANFQ